MRIVAAVLLSACCAAPLQAKKIYKVVDANGVVHYTDRKPDGDGAATAEVISVRAERQPIASMRLEGLQRERRIVVTNRIAGPVEVELRFGEASNVAGSPPLPLRAVVAAASEATLSTVRGIDESQPSRFEIEFQAVPGDPAAMPDGHAYRLPVDVSDPRIDQGFGGRFSHTDPQSRYAIDLAADEGTPILAARDGVVMQVEDDFEGSGLDREKYGGRANHVRVLHADGTMAIYAHLQPESVVVAPGARVREGQQIGASGNTGFSTGPHLHFALQVNRGLELVSIPFDLVGPDGPIALPPEP